jgi:hypothetical protein
LCILPSYSGEYRDSWGIVGTISRTRCLGRNVTFIRVLHNDLVNNLSCPLLAYREVTIDVRVTRDEGFDGIRFRIVNVGQGIFDFL